MMLEEGGNKNEELAAAVTRPDDPYQTKLGAGPYARYPYCIYFYYVLPADVDGISEVRHYYYARNGQPLINRADVEAEVAELIDNARKPPGQQLPVQVGENWKFATWDRISYVAIFIDDSSVKIEPYALDVNIKAGGTVNHSFFDAWQQPMKGSTAIICANHMKADQQGTQLGLAKEYFHFDLNTKPPLEWVDDVRFPDSGGTNMGPPIGPP